MRNLTKALAIGTVLAAVGGIGVAAMAQTTGPGFGPGMMMGHGMMGGTQRQGFGNPAARLAAVKADFAITPQQNAAWDAYAKVVQDTATAMRASREKMNPDTIRAMSPQDRGTFLNAQWEQRDKAFASVKGAATTLLASLDDAQKAKANAELPGLAARGPMGMQQGDMPMMGHGMGMGPMGGRW
jgi:hypothetical protein